MSCLTPLSLDLSVNNAGALIPEESGDWLKSFAARYSLGEVEACLDRASALKALVVGESIIDEYVFCDGLGKSTKDPILAFQYRWSEAYAGGSLAVANHLAGFCHKVGLVTFLGETERREDFVHGALLPNVRPYFLTQAGAPTIHKRRFVDRHTSGRVFELYVMDDTLLDPTSDSVLVDTLSAIVAEYDVIVVADYGHGMMTPASIALLCHDAPFLAVNTQANAGNRGFNTISKYSRADYVCLAGHEVSLETRMRHAHWHDLVTQVTKHIDCPRFTVTQGRDGTLHYQPEWGFVHVPALATHVTDRVGAGDAVLAVTSLLVARNVPWEIVGLIGNLAGAEMVAELGNRKSVNREAVSRRLASIIDHVKVGACE